MTTPNAGNGDRQKTQTQLEMEAGRKQGERYTAQRAVPPKKPNATTNVIPFSPDPTLGAGNESIDTGPAKAAEELRTTEATAKKQQNEQPGPNADQKNQSGTSAPKFDHATAHNFYNAVRPTAFMLGFKDGRHVTSAEEFQVLTKDADDQREHLFFPVATLKPEWANPKTHEKGKITTPSKDKAVNMPDGTTSHVLECPYLWGDCDAEKYAGSDPVEAAKHYENEGFRVRTAINEGLNRLGITPYAIWRSGAGWQFLIKLDQAIQPDEAETLVGKLHTALGFDPVVRNCNRILRVPGSVNWKNGKDGRVPSPCVPLSMIDAVTNIDDVRKALADIDEPEKEGKASGGTETKIDWPKVKRPGWLKSVADLPDDAPVKLKHIIGHTGNLKELNEDLIQLGILTKRYGSWSDVTHALAAGFKYYGKYTPEQIAEALLADLPCNQHVAKQKDKQRVIERAITRSHDPKPKPNEPKVEGNWPGGFNEETGKPRNDILNTIEAIKRAGIICTYDLFRCKEFWNGHADKKFDGEISDAAVTLTREAIRRQFKFYPEKVETQEAITIACHHNKRDPVLDYFAGLKWDGTPRLAKMLTNYLGAPDTPLNDAFSIKTMCAIVRRAKNPGCKYDQELVLQGKQEIRKSTFCEDLAVAPDLYTDAGDLGAAIKDQIDVTQGKQIIEFPERAGHSDRARDRNKASLSRKVDRARLSYAHYATDTPRRWIGIATCNPGGIYNDPTGERRYWHVAATNYDRDGFMAVKEQLYAEAVALEPGEKLYLDTDELKAAHDVIVSGAKEDNELVNVLSDLKGEIWDLGGGKREERVSTADVRSMLGMFPSDALRSHDAGRRIAEAMMTLNWTKAPGTIRCHKGDQATSGYTRPLPCGPRNARPLHPASQTADDVGEPTEGDAALDERIAAGTQGNSGPGLTGPIGATGAQGSAGAQGNSGPSMTGITSAASAADVTGGATLDQGLAQGAAQAQADLAFVRGNS